jgi:hypothetical protein
MSVPYSRRCGRLTTSSIARFRTEPTVRVEVVSKVTATSKDRRCAIGAICIAVLVTLPACAQTEQPASANEGKAFMAFSAVEFANHCSLDGQTPLISDKRAYRDKLKIGDQMLNRHLSTPFRLISLQLSAEHRVAAINLSEFTIENCNGAMATVRQVEAQSR